ncbi:MAG: hypothetical protein IJV13_01490 [Prevotella sp.]|nr:hypothetical protein [Prevotella sp.]MBQ9650878.1 hypothetical protein [Prevotella sp.]
MKKIIVMALMVLGTSAAFAQTDIVKTVKKAKTYADAVQAAQGMEALSEDEQAKVYDVLLKLSSKEFEADKKNYDAARAFLECATNYAQKNPKGAMKYYVQLNDARNSLLDPGQEGLTAQDYQKVYDNLHYYVDAANIMYEGDYSKDQGVPQITYFVAVAASQLGKDKEAIRYAQPALNDSTYGGAAMSIKLAALRKAVKNHNDSIEFISEVKDLYGKYPVGAANDVVLQEVVNYYSAPEYKAELNKVFDEVKAKDPNNKMLFALIGQTAMNNREYDAAIENFGKAIELDPTFTAVRYNLALCLNQKAMEVIQSTPNGKPNDEAKALLNQSVEHALKVKAEDPERKVANWAYTLYQAYYMLEDEANAKVYEDLMNN